MVHLRAGDVLQHAALLRCISGGLVKHSNTLAKAQLAVHVENGLTSARYSHQIYPAEASGCLLTRTCA